MDLKRKRKPKKVYRTVIKLTPSKDPSKFGSEPRIEIDSETLRPKFTKPRPKSRGLPRKREEYSDPMTKSRFKLAKRLDEALIQRKEWVPVTNKTHWKCIRCGWCCSHDWRVNLTWYEYDRLKDKLPIDKVVMDEDSGMSHPLFSIKGHCIQYDKKDHKCKIYKNRAYSCATFPFSLTIDGKLVRSKFCKGFGKGDLVIKKKMIEYIMKWRKRAGMKV